MQAEVIELLCKWGVLSRVEDTLVLGSFRIDGISYQELTEMVNRILELKSARAASYLFSCFVCSEWTEHLAHDGLIGQEMQVYAVLPRETAIRLVNLASRWIVDRDHRSAYRNACHYLQ